MERNDDADNSFHIALIENASIDIVSLLVDVGGEALVMKKYKYGSNSLVYAWENNASVDVIYK